MLKNPSIAQQRRRLVDSRRHLHQTRARRGHHSPPCKTYGCAPHRRRPQPSARTSDASPRHIHTHLESTLFLTWRHTVWPGHLATHTHTYQVHTSAPYVQYWERRKVSSEPFTVVGDRFCRITLLHPSSFSRSRCSRHVGCTISTPAHRANDRRSFLNLLNVYYYYCYFSGLSPHFAPPGQRLEWRRSTRVRPSRRARLDSGARSKGRHRRSLRTGSLSLRVRW